jgi:hypothetical protein
VEPTLAITMDDLRASVGDFLGWGRSSSDWSEGQQARIAEVLKSGLRQFYYPTVMEGLLYEWSFLKPSREVVLASGERAVTLPADFNGIEGPVVVSESDSPEAGGYCPVRVMNPGYVDAEYARRPSSTGRPMFASVRVRPEVTRDRGQRHELYVYPEADRAYRFRIKYSIHPEALTEKAPDALGGPAHAETILESCLAIAEQRLDDSMGVHTAKYRERLAASVNSDRRHKPQHLGYNGDRDWDGDALYHRNHRGTTFSMNGTELF